MSTLDFSQDAMFDRAPQPKKSRRWLLWLGLAITFVVLSLFVSFVFRVRSVLVSFPQPSGAGRLDVTDAATATLIARLTHPEDPAVGPSDAKVVVVEFSDFQCPFCQQMHPVFRELQRRYGKEVRFVYRHFPLVGDHPQSVVAALAGACAHEQGKFWEMHDKLFSDQEHLSEEMFKTYAIQIGLNSLQFSQCYQSRKYLQKVQQDLDDGIELGVTATPTFFINNVKVDGAVPIDQLEQIILRQLAS